MNITNLVNIKKYPAGKNGNMLVSLDEKLAVNEKFSGPKGDERSVSVMIATAFVRDKATIAEIRERVDDFTPFDRIIVVNKKFMRLPSKMQLALLEEQNAKLELDSEEVESNIDRQVHGEMAAMEKIGVIPTKLAMKSARKTREHSEVWASRGRHRAYKRQERAINRLGNDANAFAQILNDMGEMELEEEGNEDVIVNPTPNPSTSNA